MSDIRQEKYAEWLEETLSELVDLKPEHIGIVTINADGSTGTAYFDVRNSERWLMVQAIIQDNFDKWPCMDCCEGDRRDPITHYDRIVSKTLEELADFIGGDPMRDICPNNCHDDLDRPCKVCALAWLKREVE